MLLIIKVFTKSQKGPPRPRSTICYGRDWARKSHHGPGLRLATDKSGPEKPPTPGVQFVTDTNGPKRVTKTRDYDLLRIRVGQRPGSARTSRPGSTICDG